jgi:hypothetical protein
MNWQSELINLGFLVAILAAGYLHVLTPDQANMLAGGLVAARLALLKPPGSGGPPAANAGGGASAALAGSAVGAIALGVLALMGQKVHS